MKIYKVYFSPTGNCRKICDAAAKAAESSYELIEDYDITLPQNREAEIILGAEDLLVICMPVYASRLPNKIMPFVRDNIRSYGAKAIAMVAFGNRSFGDGLSELAMILRENGFKVIGGAAVASEHSFAQAIGTGRPGEKDLEEISEFVKGTLIRCDEQVELPGNTPPGEYYRPLGEDNKPAIFLKAKPVTDEERCIECGQCAKACSMGSINPLKPAQVEGICIKCQACIKICKQGAKSFEDEAFLSHKRMLEKNYKEPKQNLFIN